MPAPILVDTGPLVALLCRSDRHHAWVHERFAEIEPPLLTCEAVLSEADHLTRRHGRAPGPLPGHARVARRRLSDPHERDPRRQSGHDLRLGLPDLSPARARGHSHADA